MRTAILTSAAACLAATLPAPVSAADLLYSLTPQGGTGYTASWRMALNPSVTQAVEGQGFAIERVSGMFPRTTYGDAYLDFYFTANGGGLMISDADGPRTLATLFGEQLYTGSERTPTMTRGTFTLTATQTGGRRYSLLVVDALPAIPEPSTWLLMISGFGMVGAALRSRRRINVSYA